MSHVTITKAKGILFVLSAPSAAGKSTVANILIEKVEGLRRSISHTTREKREGEKHGADYYFIDEKKFKEMVRLGEFIEWANVHGSLYGTSLKALELVTEQERVDVLLVIDTQGAKTLKGKGVACRAIFLLPPSMEELKKRLTRRGGDSAKARELRLSNAREEIGERSKFDYIIINDNLDSAVSELHSIVVAERLKPENRSITFGS